MPSKFNALWIDDERPQPDDCEEYAWTCARSFHEAIFKLELLEFDRVSFDHDLASFYGNKEMTGYDVALWLVQRKMDGHAVPTQYNVHSANPVGRDRIQGVIERYLTPEKEV
jgi:hypothetical protein